MRWIPALFIVLLVGVSGLDIAINFKKIQHPRFMILSWLYTMYLLAVLFMPIASNGLVIHLTTPRVGRVNLQELQLTNLEFVENIIMTVPLGVIIKKYFSKLPLTLIAILGIILSGSFETVQYVLSHLFLINRTSDINDVISNTLGIVIGAILMLLYRYFKTKGEN
ncbi:VanZ family protein [Companilactobacillus alimentarius]